MEFDFYAASGLKSENHDTTLLKSREEWDLINSIYEAQQEKDIKDED